MNRRSYVTGLAVSRSVAACGTGVHRSLTRTDLLLCVVPIAVFLSIVSLV
jgi:hypothetical protein